MLNKTSENQVPEIEPWCSERSVGRLLHDLGIVMCHLTQKVVGRQSTVLDFAGGNLWLSEILARSGFKVVAMDYDPSIGLSHSERKKRWYSSTERNLKSLRGDGHRLPFADETFDSIVCFDSLHHMASFDLVCSSMFRVCKEGGKCIFVEPGALHSTSPETIHFLKMNEHKLGSHWIERSIYLEEIDIQMRHAGFSNGIKIIPKIHPISHPVMSLSAWQSFRSHNDNIRNEYCNYLSDINYNHHLIFFVEKA